MRINSRVGESDQSRQLRRRLSRLMRSASASVAPPAPGLRQKMATDANGVTRGVGFFWGTHPARARRASAPTIASLKAQISAVFHASTRQGRALARISSMKLRAEALDVEVAISEGRAAFAHLGLTSK